MCTICAPDASAMSRTAASGRVTLGVGTGAHEVALLHQRVSRSAVARLVLLDHGAVGLTLAASW